MKYIKLLIGLLMLAVVPVGCDDKTALEKAEMWNVSGITPVTIKSDVVPGAEFQMYVIEPGTGRNPSHGDYVCIRYSAFTITGTAFATTIDSDPACYNVDTQVTPILGLDEALMYTRKDGKYRFVFPAEMAFGDEYSSNGIVPPNTSVVYDVELTSIN